MQGTMKRDIHLLGTSLRLLKGQIVNLTPATNIPEGGYFARPLNCVWPDGIERDSHDSIYISPSEAVDDLMNINTINRRTRFNPEWYEIVPGVIRPQYEHTV